MVKLQQFIKRLLKSFIYTAVVHIIASYFLGLWLLILHYFGIYAHLKQKPHNVLVAWPSSYTSPVESMVILSHDLGEVERLNVFFY